MCSSFNNKELVPSKQASSHAGVCDEHAGACDEPATRSRSSYGECRLSDRNPVKEVRVFALGVGVIREFSGKDITIDILTATNVSVIYQGRRHNFYNCAVEVIKPEGDAH